jgi:hypothetical protein
VFCEGVSSGLLGREEWNGMRTFLRYAVARVERRGIPSRSEVRGDQNGTGRMATNHNRLYSLHR